MKSENVDYDALVATIIDEHRVVINKGKQDGVKKGQEYVIFGLGPEVQDPKTQENLGRVEVLKGRGEVIHVQDNISTVESNEYDFNQTIIRKKYGGPGGAFGRFYGAQQKQEEEVEKTKQRKPFDEVSKGDYLRKK
jgi:cell shape-determining protein MreC